jgi:hypothetical protein
MRVIVGVLVWNLVSEIFAYHVASCFGKPACQSFFATADNFGVALWTLIAAFFYVYILSRGVKLYGVFSAKAYMAFATAVFFFTVVNFIFVDWFPIFVQKSMDTTGETNITTFIKKFLGNHLAYFNFVPDTTGTTQNGTTDTNLMYYDSATVSIVVALGVILGSRK